MNHLSHPPKPFSTLLFWLVVHGVALIALLTVFIGVVPAFDKMFMEFGLKLSLLSAILVNLSRILITYGLILIPIGVLLDGGMLCLLFLAVGMPRWFRSLWCYGVLIFAGVLFLLIVVGMFLPLMRLTQGLS